MLTGGGGAPGPVNELDAEIYYPAYLYLKDGSGNLAPRPAIVAAPARLTLGQNFWITVGSNDQILHYQPYPGGDQLPFIQSGAAADPRAVHSKWNNGQGEVWFPLRKKFRQANIPFARRPMGE